MYTHPLEGIVIALKKSYCPKPPAKKALAVEPAGFLVGGVVLLRGSGP